MSSSRDAARIALAPSGLSSLATGWTFAGIIAVASFLLSASGGDTSLLSARGVASVVVFGLLIAVAERSDVRISYGDHLEAVSMVEAPIVAALVALSPTWALATIVVAIAAVHLHARRGWVKTSINIGNYTVSAVVGVAATRFLRGGADPLSLVGLTAATVGVVLFAAVNSFSLTVVLARAQGRSIREMMGHGSSILIQQAIANTSVGLLAAVLWSINPPLLVLVAVPIVTLWFAYRGIARTRFLLAAVEAERDRLDRVVTGASDGIALLGPDGAVLVWSPALAELTGIPEHAAVGHRISEVIDGFDHDGGLVDQLGVIATTSADRPRASSEMIVSHPNGQAHIVQVAHTGLFDERGRLTGDVMLVHDITRRREVERMKDDFVARVSHELRTPLTPIKGFAETLSRNSDRMSPDMMRRAIARISNRADHMVRLIDDLLLVSSMSTHETDSPPGMAVEMAARCREVVARYDDEQPDRRFELSLDDTVRAYADPQRIGQILDVLLSNACLYSPPDSVVTVTLIRRPPDTGRDQECEEVVDACEEELLLTVQDRGRGIPVEHTELIFERFHRVEDPLVMTTSGLGVGLYIARHLAESMGGTLTVDSVLDQGSRFALCLPALPDPARAVTAGASDAGGHEQVEGRVTRPARAAAAPTCAPVGPGPVSGDRDAVGSSVEVAR